MKKALKIIGALVLACILVAGGYIAGQRVQVSSVISAMPKRSVDNTPPEGALPEESLEPDASFIPIQEPRLDEVITDRVIAVSDTSAVDEAWSRVAGTTNATNNEALTLYTSAEKDGDEFIWDDSQKWVLELSDGEGGYYTLYDQQVTNGNVYYEVAEKENGDRIIYLYTITGSGTSIMQYTRTDTGFTEKAVYNSGAVNRLFSSVPEY